MSSIFHIKNMVCDRCIRTVEKIFLSYNALPERVELGVVEVANEVPIPILQKIESDLNQEGFALLKDKPSILVEQIKNLIIDLVSTGKISQLNKNLSAVIEEMIGKEYHYLSALFSETEGLTIARYLILQKIEKAKEYLSYQEKSLGTIAENLGYSSVHHFSNQFKDVTGSSPSDFRDRSDHTRTQLDKV